MTKDELLADEAFMIRDGGEMPVVAYNSALYYLQEDEDGPQLALTGADVSPLKDAVVQRFRTIILRDLQPENRQKSIYRGVERSCANWFRLLAYCQQEAIPIPAIRREAAEALGAFLQVELQEVRERGGRSGLNCTWQRLQEYAESLDVELDEAVQGWRNLFAD